MSDFDICVFAMNWLPFWYVFSAMLPLDFRLIWIGFLSQLVVTLDSLCLPCYKLTCLHMQNTTVHSGKSAECALKYTYTSCHMNLSSLLSAPLAFAARSVTIHRANPIRVPLLASAHSSVSGLHVALFNAPSISTLENVVKSPTTLTTMQST